MTRSTWPSDSPPHLVVLTGAGLSAESGLKTFRDSDGLWEGHDINEICNFNTWRQNLRAVHRFYSERRAAAAAARPNAAHDALASWQSRWPTTILTQNVDDLLERAGCPDVVHLHGRLSDMECHACGHRWVHGLVPWDPDADACVKCGSSRDVKPGIVFFGEMAPQYQALQSALQSLRRQDVFVVIGTSGYVLPVANMARLVPGLAILNNLAPSAHIDDIVFGHVFYQPATQAVGRIEEILQNVLG